jgi:isoquinoline 1-oxidoreductase beta subunit
VDLPYQVPNQRVELHSPTVHLHASPTRFGGTLHNGFANECMIDEVAHALRRDPIELREHIVDPPPIEERLGGTGARASRLGPAACSRASRRAARTRGGGHALAPLVQRLRG